MLLCGCCCLYSIGYLNPGMQGVLALSYPAITVLAYSATELQRYVGFINNPNSIFYKFK